jgi:hypothetical protein
VPALPASSFEALPDEGEPQAPSSKSKQTAQTALAPAFVRRLMLSPSFREPAWGRRSCHEPSAGPVGERVDGLTRGYKPLPNSKTP